MKSISQEYHIMAPLEKVWGALIDSGEINKWGGGPAKMSDEQGFEFSLWGGDIHGKNIEVERNKKLVQEWSGGDWKEPSLVTFILSHKDGCTRVILKQTKVPNESYKDIDRGWEEYYLGRIKEYLEK